MNLKRLFLFLPAFLLATCSAFSQTFTGTGGAISYVDTSRFDIVVSGLPTVIDTSFGLVSLTLNITHPHIRDIDCFLAAPNGRRVEITTDNGGATGANYINTVFRDDATVSITVAIGPCTGTFYPEGLLSDMNRGQDPNGTWELRIIDDTPASNNGTLTNWSIEFGNNPPAGFYKTNLPIVMINTLGHTIVQNVKVDGILDIKYNGAGNMTYITDSSNVYSGHMGIEIRGASSAGYPQTPYNIETHDTSGNPTNMMPFDMPAESDWALISNYNDRSLIRNMLAYQLFHQMGNYATRTILCEALVDSAYKGIYVFCEKIKRDHNRVNIAKMTSLDNAGDSLTGGYILQQNLWTASNSFLSNYHPIDHPTLDVHFLYEYPKYDSITPQQKTYIASFIDSLEGALYSANFTDPVNGYRKYLDVKSFIDYFIVNELARNNDGFKKSVFFNKDRFSINDKLKAGPVWDFDWAWKNIAECSIFANTDGSGWAYKVNDCNPDNYSCGYMVRMMQDTDFVNELQCTYQQYRRTFLDTTTIFAYADSVRDYVQDAQARHFKQWPILGVPGPAPEVNAIATTYNAEIDTLKAWIALRLSWLDANMPGQCLTTAVQQVNSAHPLQYFPNPSTGSVHFEGILDASSSSTLNVFDASGKRIDVIHLNAGNVNFDYQFDRKGFYYFSITNDKGLLQHGKLIVL